MIQLSAQNSRTSCWRQSGWRADAVDWGRLRVSEEWHTVRGINSKGYSLALSPCLIRTPGHCVLVDCGLQDSWIRDDEHISWLPPECSLQQQFNDLRLEPSDVQDLVVTHLDGDHISGLFDAELKHNGFPNARIHIQQRAIDWWQKEFEGRDRVRYLHKRVLLALLESPQLVIHDGDWSLGEGLELKLMEGHTPGHQILLAGPEGELVVSGDLLATRASFRPNTRSRTDTDEELGMQNRDKLRELPVDCWYLYHGLPGKNFYCPQRAESKIVLDGGTQDA